MKILDKILRRHPAQEAGDAPKAECVHAVLASKWDSAADIGNDAKVSRYECESCGTAFTPDEGRKLQESLAERVHLGE